jgi:hypothetical protein
MNTVNTPMANNSRLSFIDMFMISFSCALAHPSALLGGLIPAGRPRRPHDAITGHDKTNRAR